MGPCFAGRIEWVVATPDAFLFVEKYKLVKDMLEIYKTIWAAKECGVLHENPSCAW